MSVSPYSTVALSRGAWHFLIGKSISAPLTVIILFLLVRLLSVDEYGAYVTLVAGMELTLVLTSFGLPWVAARYLPESRLHSEGRGLARLVRQIIQRYSAAMIAATLLLNWAIPYLLASLELAQYSGVARVYLLVLILEGTARFTRDALLGPLLQQRASQLSLVVRNLTFLILLCLVAFQYEVHVLHVVVTEAIASSLGALLALFSLYWYLRTHRDLPGKPGYCTPDWGEMWRVGRPMYFSHLISMIYSGDVLILLIQRYLGVEATALFGFLHRIYLRIVAYLPATLLFSLIRPRLVASYVGAGGMRGLTQDANLAGKFSLFALMPVIIVVALTGNELLDLLSGGKFPNAGNYFTVLLLVLIPLSQRQILETVAVAADMSQLCFSCGLLAAVALPLAYWLLESGEGLMGPIVALLVGEIIFNAKLVTALSGATTYRPDAIGFVKLGLAALAAFGMVQQIELPISDTARMVITASLTFGLYLVASYFIKPFYPEERERVNRLLKRRLFIW